MYLFMGNDKALLTDTGATKEEDKFPLYKTVRGLISEWEDEHSTSLYCIHTTMVIIELQMLNLMVNLRLQ